MAMKRQRAGTNNRRRGLHAAAPLPSSSQSSLTTRTEAATENTGSLTSNFVFQFSRIALSPESAPPKADKGFPGFAGLPVEICTAIFEAHTNLLRIEAKDPLSQQAGRAGMQAHHPLMLVCRAWHDLILATPALWAKITVVISAFHFLTVAPIDRASIERHLSLSKNYPLDVEIILTVTADHGLPSRSYPQISWLPVLRSVLEHSQRFRSFRIEDFDGQMLILPMDLPLLRAIDLTGENGGPSGWTHQLWSSSWRSMLDSVSVFAMPSVPALPDSLAWRHIRRFKTDRLDLLLYCLQEDSKNLEEVALVDRSVPLGSPVEDDHDSDEGGTAAAAAPKTPGLTVVHHSLQSLTLDGSTPGAAELLRKGSFPALTELHLLRFPNTFLPFDYLRHRMHYRNLLKLTLHDVNIRQADESMSPRTAGNIYHALNNLTSLRVLYISDSLTAKKPRPTCEFPLEVLTRPPTGAPGSMVLPRLQAIRYTLFPMAEKSGKLARSTAESFAKGFINARLRSVLRFVEARMRHRFSRAVEAQTHTGSITETKELEVFAVRVEGMAVDVGEMAVDVGETAFAWFGERAKVLERSYGVKLRFYSG
ncbi:F-box domain-containing protein [Mycena chlorophos]|uniref:F-box domain-containing protein n=1 Tax=Mycena chlorophos TaxID=658473 RepID=A0A8H6RXD2_MYCCL|nr:F-box domain-containing protein [Mycena chlorophos]